MLLLKERVWSTNSVCILISFEIQQNIVVKLPDSNQGT